MSGYEQFILASEQRDQIRWSWNAWPHSRLDLSRVVLPLGALYSPLRDRPPATENLPFTLPYEPVLCGKHCRAVLNPFW